MLLTFGAAILVIILTYVVYKRLKDREENEKNRKLSESSQSSDHIGSATDKLHNERDAAKLKTNFNKKHAKMDNKKKVNVAFVHPWLSTALKGHIGDVSDFDFSANGKYVVSCCDDRSLIVWNTAEFESNEHKNVRGNIDFDSASKICFAPDSKSLVTCLRNDNKIAVFKLVKKDTGATGSGLKIVEVEGVGFPNENLHKSDVLSMGIDLNGKYLMTASTDTTVVVRDLKGNVLKILDSKQGNNYCVKVSPCGRFIGCSGFTPDVKVWAVDFAKNSDFKDVTRAFELKGHTSGVRSFDFNQDSTRMVSASKDGTFRVWDTDIKYSLGQEPYLLLERHCEELKAATGGGAEFVSLAMSPNGQVLALALDDIVKTFCATTGDCLGVIKQRDPAVTTPAYFSVGPKFSADGKYILLAVNRQILVFHNVPGYKTAAKLAKDQVKKANSAAHKERLQQQADEAQQMAAKFPDSW